MSSEPRPTWPPEGLGWPGLCTLTCLTGMPVGDQVSKPKRHCFRPPGWYGQEHPLDSQYPGFRVNTRSSRVTTQVNQPHFPEGWTCKEPPQVMAREPSIRVDLRVGGVSADTQVQGRKDSVHKGLSSNNPNCLLRVLQTLPLPSHPTLRADPSST